MPTPLSIGPRTLLTSALLTFIGVGLIVVALVMLRSELRAIFTDADSIADSPHEPDGLTFFRRLLVWGVVLLGLVFGPGAIYAVVNRLF